MRHILSKLTAVSTVALTLLSVTGGAVSANSKKVASAKPRVARVSAKKGVKVIKGIKPKASKKASVKGLKKQVAKRAKRAKKASKRNSARGLYKFLSSFYNDKGTVKVNRKNKRAIQREFHPLGVNSKVRNHERFNIVGSRNIKNGTQTLVSYTIRVGRGRKGKLTSYGYLQKLNKKAVKTNKVRKGRKAKRAKKVTRKGNKRVRKSTKRARKANKRANAKMTKRIKRAKKLNRKAVIKNSKQPKKVIRKMTMDKPVTKVAKNAKASK